MKDCENWKPSKFITSNDRWIPTKNVKELGRSSRLISLLQLRSYQIQIENHAAGRLLDFGCGKFPLYGIYKSKISEVVGIDWDASLHKNSHIDYYTDLNMLLPFKENEFDTILATDVLEHLENPLDAWIEMKRVLRPNGKIIIGVPFLYWIHEEPHDYFRFTEYQLRKICDRLSLKVLVCEPYGGVPEVLSDLLAKHLTFSRLLSGCFYFICLFLLKLPFIRWWSRKTQRRFPLGYCLVAQK